MSRRVFALCLIAAFSLTLASAADNAKAPRPNGNRLTYLDEPCNPYYVHRDFPKLTTPMWVGEEGVEAVVILGIDDMRGHEKWEAYLRPILNRLKQIDGRAPVSIMTCTIDPKHPHLQQWLEEGLSLEVHTVDHPCPLLGGMKGLGVRGQGPGGSNDAKPDAAPLDSRLSALDFSKDTYDRCVDLLHEVPNNKPVCFRMPCCDSLNTLSPRFFTEIFAKTTEKGHFLQADSSVFNVFTSDDPALPRELVLERADATRRTGGVSPLVDGAKGDGQDTRGLTPPVRPDVQRERFKKYIPTDRFFANTIENYPYPYVIDRLCWEFPCVTPSDWSAQHLHKPHNPQTVEDWKAALDCTVIKQGVFCLVFHPHNWIKPEQVNELIDHAVTKHGKKIKFLTFKDAVERLNKNVLGGLPIRQAVKSVPVYSTDPNRRPDPPFLEKRNPAWLADLNGDGWMDVSAHTNAVFKTRILEEDGKSSFEVDSLLPIQRSKIWLPELRRWSQPNVRKRFDLSEKPASNDAVIWNGSRDVTPRFGCDGTNSVLQIDQTVNVAPSKARLTNSQTGHEFRGQKWLDDAVLTELVRGLSAFGQPRFARDLGIRFRDLDGDGVSELLVGNPRQQTIFRRNEKGDQWSKLPFSLPQPGVFVIEPTQDDDRARSNPTIATVDSGLRFFDLNEDGHDDLVFSNHERYGVWLWESLEKGWSRELLAGQRGSKPANEELPPIVRADGSNNGFWVHARNLVWMNEDTAKSKDLVERRSFEDLLARRLGIPARPDGASTPNETKTEDRSGKNAHPPEDGPKSPEESLKLMQVKPGYRVELVAAEPLVRDPVAFDWGPDGKLWVAEMADYPLGVGEGEEADGEDASLKANGGSQPPGPSESASNPKSTSELTPTVRLLERAGHKRGGGRVRVLEDTDGDGKYDKSTLFLNKLNFPNGVMAWRDGVLISAAPDVLFARDTNGDGRADEVKVLLTGFGEGNQQHRVNGFSWGLDNMVHCANGDSGGQITVVAALRDAKSKPETTTKSESRSDSATFKTIDIRGRDFRWNPDTGVIDPTSGQTQFGRNRDDFGNWFGNNNANPMYHFVLDDFYTRRNPHVAPPDPRKQVSITPGPSPVFPISRTLARFNDFAMANRFTSANSAMVYRDELLFERSRHAPRDEPRRDNAPKGNKSPSAESTSKERSARHAERDGYVAHVFISEPVHNLVHHEVMTADGVTFTSRRADDEQQSEFLASKDNWFRPTQIKTGPDGALYIADMYRQVIEHPQYIPPALQEKLDLRAGHDKGRIYRVIPEGESVRSFGGEWTLDNIPERSLLLQLDAANGTLRDLAHRMLYWQHSEKPSKFIIESLHATVQKGWLWPGVEGPPQLPLVLNRVESSWRGQLHALALLEAFRSLATEDISQALQNKSAVVRRRALQAVENFEGDLPDPLINQLSGMGNDPDPFVRMQFAYTLGHPKLSFLGNELGKLLYRERDNKYLVAAAMSSIHAKNVASVVANYLEAAASDANASHGNDSPTKAQLASMLLGLASTLGNDPALFSLIEYVLSGAATSESQPIVLAQMLDNLERRKTSLGDLKGVSPQRLARAQQQLAGRIEAARTEISNFKSQLSNNSEIKNQKSKIGNDAIAALPLLGRVADQRGEDAKLVGELLVPQTPVPVQTAAVATLARINHEASASALLSGWRTFTPALRTQVLDALLSRPNWTGTLLDQLEAKSIAPSDIDATRRQRLTAHANKDLRTRAAKLLEVSANVDRQKIVAEVAAKLKDTNIASDATRGAEVFKKRCATCHKLKDIGTSVGSDLMSLTDKSTAALLTAILDPNKAVEAKFLAYSAVNKQGQLFSGLIAAETGNSITLMAADGKQHTLLRADLDEFMSSGKSFMPEGLEKDVAPRELADVIAFVQSSGPPSKKFDGNQPEPVTADASGTLKLLAINAEIYGKTLVFEPPFKNLGYWGSVDDRAVWTIKVTKPGKHSIRMNYACDNSTAGNEVVFEVAGQSVKAKIVGTGSWENYQTAILGEVDLPAGQHRLTVRAAETLKNHLMDLKELRLVPE